MDTVMNIKHLKPPKERAIEIYTKLYSVGSEAKSDAERDIRAKHFGMVACERILEHKIPKVMEQYWQQVKTEIENL